jgi:ATP-binding cassette subfamily B protein
VPRVVDRPDFSRSVLAALIESREIRSAEVSSLTGSVLTTFNATLPTEQIRDILDTALLHAARTPSSPSAKDLTNGEESGAAANPFVALLTRTRKHQKKAVVALAASFLDRLFEAAPPAMIGMALDVVTRGSGSALARFGLRTVPAQLSALGIIAGAVWTLDSIMGYVHAVAAADLANAVRQDLRNEVYEHFQQLDVAQIEAESITAWESLINDDVSRIANFIEEGLDPIVTIAANGAIVFGTFLSTSPRLTLVQLAVLPGVFFVSTYLLPPVRDRRISVRRAEQQLHSLVHANITGIAVIASFNREQLEAQRVAEKGREVLDAHRYAYRLSAAYIPAIQMVVGVGFLTTLVAGGLLVHRGALVPGEYNLMSFTSLRLLVALGRAGVSIDAYQRARLSVDRVLRFLSRTPHVASGPDPLPRGAVIGDIRFSGVFFKYEPDRPLFKGLDLHFPAGKTIGLMGPTGAGKSSILKLLLRFYEISDGRIEVDGRDIRSLQTPDLRRVIAYVPQQVFLFPGTVRENIAYSDLNASMDRVIAAATLAEAHRFIEALPDGYDTRIGDGGRSLSGGQRQRLAIARAFLADAQILLFDEATSAVDNETEAAIQRSLHDYSSERTTIVVAHRLSTIRQADLIYVLDEGEVRESGSHDELLRADGIYASFWRVQTGEPRAVKQPSRAKGPKKRR